MIVSPTNGKRVSIASLIVLLEHTFPRTIILKDVHANDDDSQSDIASAEAKDHRSQGSQEHLGTPGHVECPFACCSMRPGMRGVVRRVVRG